VPGTGSELAAVRGKGSSCEIVGGRRHGLDGSRAFGQQLPDIRAAAVRVRARGVSQAQVDESREPNVVLPGAAGVALYLRSMGVSLLGCGRGVGSAPPPGIERQP